MNNTIASPAFVSAPAQVVSVKRIADVVISLIVLVALALPAAVIAAILKANGPVVDSQLVAGHQGGFVKYSFHTGGAFGSFLQASGLAIIPTFFNVLRGDMNLVELAPTTDGTSDARVIAKALVAAFTK
ncbi:MAG: sugar transferase [Ancrocorticia sp.]